MNEFSLSRDIKRYTKKKKKNVGKGATPREGFKSVNNNHCH